MKGQEAASVQPGTPVCLCLAVCTVRQHVWHVGAREEHYVGHVTHDAGACIVELAKCPQVVNAAATVAPKHGLVRGLFTITESSK